MTALDEASPVGTDETSPSPAPDVPVTAHRTVPGRTVFTENGNTDAWIATDLTVGLDR
jgi:hypothetical protein